MADQTLTTKFIWDTASVQRGAREIDADYAKVMEAEKRLAKFQKLYGTGSKGFGKNTVQGIKDLGEGRTLFGLSRLSKESKGLMIALGGIGIAALAARKAFGIVRDEMEKTNAESKRLESSFLKVNRAATFSTAAEGFQSLSAKQTALDAQVRAEQDQQASLMSVGEKTDSAGSRAFWGLYNKFRRSDLGTGLFGEEKSPDQMQQESAMRTQASRNSLKRNRGLGTEALEIERTRARMGGPTGEQDPFETKRFELRVQKEKELNEIIESRGKDDKVSLDLVKSKYKWLLMTVNAEEAVARARFKGASAALAIAGGPGSGMAKTLGTAGVEMELSRSLMASGNLNAEQKRAEILKIQTAGNQQKAALMDRYLDPETGRRRPNGVIQREFRNERNATRRRRTFLRKVDAGVFNMETGRKASVGNDAGLTTGSLATGGLAAGGLSTSGLGAAFPQKSTAFVKATNDSDFLKDILKILSERLPSEKN